MTPPVRRRQGAHTPLVSKNGQPLSSGRKFTPEEQRRADIHWATREPKRKRPPVTLPKINLPEVSDD